MADSQNPWFARPEKTYNGRVFWNICRRNQKNFGGLEYAPNNNRTDPRRFYDEAKANAVAEAMNQQNKEKPHHG